MNTEHIKLNGRPVKVVYLNGNFMPCDKRQAKYLKIVSDDADRLPCDLPDEHAVDGARS